jgi:ankyrin repeat protein
MRMTLVACVLLAGCGGIGIDRRDEHGMTSLMHAAWRGDRAEAERLIRRGADVNATVPSRDLRELVAFLSWMQQLPRSDVGYRALHYAVDSGHVDVARLLIERGADVNHAARGGRTAFELAIGNSNVDMLRLLTAAGARPTPVHLGAAVAYSSPATVAFLLEHGARPFTGTTPDPERPGYTSAPTVIMATRRGDTTILRLLLEAGADVGVADGNGWSALRWARDMERQRPTGSAVVAMLQGSGARDDAGARNAELLGAVYDRNATAVAAALAAGANPNSRDDRGVPVLVIAARRGDPDVVGHLVKAGAAVNANPEHDTTPLIGAIMAGSIESVRLLLAAGASIEQRDHVRMSPLEAASSWRRAEITTLLLERTATVDPRALALAALGGNESQVRALLDAGADPNADSGHALDEAARGCYRNDNTAVILLLLERGARPSAQRSAGTPLHRAAALCDTTVVRAMLQRGGDPNARSINDGTPLISAAASGRLDNVLVLLSSRVDVNARDSDGKSALDHAARYPEIQSALRRAGAR